MLRSFFCYPSLIPFCFQPFSVDPFLSFLIFDLDLKRYFIPDAVVYSPEYINIHDLLNQYQFQTTVDEQLQLKQESIYMSGSSNELMEVSITLHIRSVICHLIS